MRQCLYSSMPRSIVLQENPSDSTAPLSTAMPSGGPSTTVYGTETKVMSFKT